MRKSIIVFLSLIVLLTATVSHAQLSSQTLVLKPGFNFACFTANISITPLQMKSLNASLDDIYLFSAAAGSFLSVSDATLTTLAAGKGYIFKNGSSSDISIPVNGTVISSIGSVTLKAGFNLVGFSKIPSVSTTFSALMNAYSLVKGVYKWSPAAGGFIQVVRDAGGTPVLVDGSDPVFRAGESYFISVTSDTSINYDGASIIVGASPVDPSASPAEIAGTLNSTAAMAGLGLNYQIASGEAFDVALLDSDGNSIPASSLDAGETNPKTVSDGQPYSFKVKDFTKSYKVIAKSKSVANKMISVFVGKVATSEKVNGRDITPIATAISMIYSDPSKPASVFKQEEEIKKADPNFQTRIAHYVNDIEAKRLALLQGQSYDTFEELEQAYKDAVVGTIDPFEIEKIREGLDAVIGKLESQLTVLEQLKDALALIASSGQSMNESTLATAQGELDAIIKTETTASGSSADQSVYQDAKIAFGMVCYDLGEVFAGGVSSSSMAAAVNSPSLLAAYQAFGDTLDARAEAEYIKGYNAVRGLATGETAAAGGRDKAIAAVVLNNASRLAVKDPKMLDEAKMKADVLVSKFDVEGTLSVVLPTGETVGRDKIYEKKGEALINAGRPFEAVEVFGGISEARIRHFGLGRAFLKLNDAENAYRNLKEAVKTIVKSGKGAEVRMESERTFHGVNEALFAFAAVLDKIKKAPASDAALTAVKQRLVEAEQGLADDGDKVIIDPNVTTAKIIKCIKPSSNFFMIGKKLVLDGQTATDFGGSFIELKADTDPVKITFKQAVSLLFKCNKAIDGISASASAGDRQAAVYAGAAMSGTPEAPAADTALKLANDAYAAFDSLLANASAPETTKGDSYYNMGLSLLAQYRALKLADIEDRGLLGRSKKIFLDIREKIDDSRNAHLAFAIAGVIKVIESLERQVEGMSSETGGPLDKANAAMKHAMNFYNGKEYKLAEAHFQKAAAAYDAVYASSDASATLKAKEAALYFSALCLHYQYRLSAAKDPSLKIKLLEKINLFRLKFPSSDYIDSTGDILDELESPIAIQLQGETGVNADIDSKPEPGVEFNRALSTIEKLRLYYKNNFSTSEIEAAFTSAEVALKRISEGAGTDAAYTGGITSETALKSFRALAKYRLGTLYMERYRLHREKDVAFKNGAVRIFNELINDSPEEFFTAEAKKFIMELQNEGSDVAEFVEGQAVFAGVHYSPRVIDLATDRLREITVKVDVAAEDTDAAGLVADVTVALKRLGNPVFADTNSSVPVSAYLVRSAANAKRWEGTLSLGQNIYSGVYDAVITAYVASGAKSTTVFPVVVKNSAAAAKIKSVELIAGPALKVITEGTDAAVYASVMQNVMQIGAASSTFEGRLVPVTDVASHVKLEASSVKNGEFILDLSSKLPSLKQGNFVFLFKLISASASNVEDSLNSPLQIFQFPFFIKPQMAAADKAYILAAYEKITQNFNEVSRSSAERIAAYEKMFVTESYKLGASERTAWAGLLDALENLKITVSGSPFIEMESGQTERVLVRAAWKIDGKYRETVSSGVFLPDGRLLLPPGRAGTRLQNFVIKIDCYFARTLDGTSWGVTFGQAPLDASKTEVIPAESVPVITKINGVRVPTDGGAVKLGVLNEEPFALIEGSKLNAISGEKRILKFYNSKLAVPLFLCENGSAFWTDTSIKFSTAPLNAMSGTCRIELFDTRYGTLASFSVRLTSTAVSAKLTIKEIVSGPSSSYPFGLIRPFEIDRTQPLALRGAGMLPSKGTYSVMYYKPPAAALSAGSFAEILRSGGSSWTANEITVAAALMPSAAAIADHQPTLLIVWDNSSNKPAANGIYVAFSRPDSPPAAPVIETVNGQSVSGEVTLIRPAGGGISTGGLVIAGKNFSQSGKVRADIMFVIDNRPEIVTMAFNDDPGWTGGAITAPVDWTKLNGKTAYPAVLVLYDEVRRAEVSVRVKLRFAAAAAPAEN